MDHHQKRRRSPLEIVVFIIILLIVTAIVFFTPDFIRSAGAPENAEASTTPEHTLTHAQEIYASALEWCESNARGGAINEVDLDGTPSFYWYQFKPGTFRGYGEKYGLIEKGKTDPEILELMKDYELTRSIVEHMIPDPAVRWENEFPDCVKTKIGRPPVY